MRKLQRVTDQLSLEALHLSFLAIPAHFLESDQECSGRFAERQAPWHSGYSRASERVLWALWLPLGTLLRLHPVNWWFFVFDRPAFYILVLGFPSQTQNRARTQFPHKGSDGGGVRLSRGGLIAGSKPQFCPIRPYGRRSRLSSEYSFPVAASFSRYPERQVHRENRAFCGRSRPR